jgi:hypothetical protein
LDDVIGLILGQPGAPQLAGDDATYRREVSGELRAREAMRGEPSPDCDCKKEDEELGKRERY